MENLKKLLGAEYKEGISLEEVDAFIGKGKFVNLNEGNYVDKDKYSKVVADRDNIKNALNELTEKTKDYDDIKKSNETFKLEKADTELKAKLVKLGIKEHDFKYVKSDIAEKVLIIDDNDEKATKKSVDDYLKIHPEFAIEKAPEVKDTKIVGSKIDPIPTNNSPKVVVNQSWNKNRGI